MKDLSTRSAYRASSDDVDGFLTLRVDPLEGERSTLRAWPDRAVVCNRALVLRFVGIDYEMLELGSDDLIMGSGLCPSSPTVALHVLLNLGVEAVLMCLDLLKLPSFARNPHINSGRDTQIPYSPVVDLVAGLEVSQVVSEHWVRFVIRVRDYDYLSHQKRLFVLRLIARYGDFVGHKMLLERTVEVQGDNNCFNQFEGLGVIAYVCRLQMTKYTRFPRRFNIRQGYAKSLRLRLWE
ncbi:hypothetical protein M9H77_31635 [Catharanthus roseus]|uniref:Uncharacterized protein n=1 Tax=Catharanthus roseus TaxID=4058 RepID=A0ACC0A0P9_CATRO|nr:hypothetical protein M9H77_31635 [Catharanthus roseus]